MAPGRHYVVLHTHPGSTSLSVLDVALLVAQPAVAMVIAVGTDGTWYIGSLDTQRQRPSLRTIYDGYDATYRATVDQYDALTTAGRLSQRQAGRRHSHEVWVQAGPALGVRYDRVAGVRRT